MGANHGKINRILLNSQYSNYVTTLLKNESTIIKNNFFLQSQIINFHKPKL